eukprot:8894292-Pyramimonas_sp.AAC.1
MSGKCPSHQGHSPVAGLDELPTCEGHSNQTRTKQCSKPLPERPNGSQDRFKTAQNALGGLQ